jgi:Reverse transcriptase (RNA-dependent DNA polymerase)
MKHSVITPLLKWQSFNITHFKNFRPITSLSTVSKILERLALVQVKSFIVESPNFFPLQSAYPTAHSTETAFAKIMYSILQDIDSGSVVSLMSLDISAAFDTICHHTLLLRLAHDFGSCGNILSWFQSYLSGKTFSVSVGLTSGIPVLLHTGVPQGSVLRPLLFTVYVSPIGRLIENCSISYHAHADDTQLFTALKSSAGNNINRLVSCVESLQCWFWHNGLFLNQDKSETIFFGTRQRLRSTQLPPTVPIAGNTISVSSTLKILGVRFDETLSFCDHINDIVRACHMQALRHIRRYMSADVARTVEFSTVGSRVDYCNALLYGAGSGLLNKLQS